MLWNKQPQNQEVPVSAEITLKYQGMDVQDGTMPLGDVIVALQGFSGAYGKIAARIDPSNQHQIRVSDINKSSFAVVVFAWVAEHHEALLKVSSSAAAIAAMIVKLIDFKKRNKGKDPAIQINGDGNIVLAGIENTQVIMGKELYELYKSKSLDVELAKIARPLEEEKIDSAELSVRDTATGQIETTRILLSEKQYFLADETTSITSRPAQLVGNLVSLNKESNRGTFRMQNGNSVKYHLAGSSASDLYNSFIHKGPVRVECTASFDENLEVRSLEITAIAPLQAPFGFGEVDTPNDSPS